MKFEFNIKFDKLELLTADKTGISGNKNTYDCGFKFDETWNGLSRFITIIDSNKKVYMDLLENNEYALPMLSEGVTYIGVFGSDLAGKNLSTNLVHVTIGQGAYTGFEEPAPDIWELYVAELAKKNDEIADGMADEISAKVSKSIKEYADTKAATAQTNAESKAASLAQAAQAAAVEYANGELAKKADSDDLPTKLSQLSDDVGYAKKTDIASTYKYKGEISSLAELGAIKAPEVGDTYNVSEDMTYVGLPIKSTDMTSWEWTKNDDGAYTGINFECSVETFPENSILGLLTDGKNRPAYIYRKNVIATGIPMIYKVYTKCEMNMQTHKSTTIGHRIEIIFNFILSAEFQWDTIILGNLEPLQLKAGDNIAWNGTSWDNLSGFVDLTPYAKKTEVAADIAAAKQAAVDAAATDAQSRANQALSSANSYTDSQIDEITIPIMSESAYAAAVFTDGKAVIVLPDGVLEG
mgnify:CR=1 FL=1